MIWAAESPLRGKREGDRGEDGNLAERTGDVAWEDDAFLRGRPLFLGCNGASEPEVDTSSVSVSIAGDDFPVSSGSVIGMGMKALDEGLVVCDKAVRIFR